MSEESGDRTQDALELMKLIQVDYRRAEQELRNMSLHLAQRQEWASKTLGMPLDALRQITTLPGAKTDGDPGPVPQDSTHNRDSAISKFTAKPPVPTLGVFCLGRFCVRVDFKEIVDWRSSKAKSLLKFLVSRQGHSVSRDILMEAFWPGFEPAMANNNLKMAVSALRKTLNQYRGQGGAFEWILFQDGNYMINPAVVFWADIERFEDLCNIGRSLEKDSRVDEAITQYESAEALYQGDYLADDIYDDWTSLKREALKDKYLTILTKLADHSLQKLDLEGCIVYCERILNQDYCREDVYRHLMCCHSRLGQRNRAIDWYHLCQKTIKKELDVDPEHKTVALYHKLLSDQPI